MMDEGRECGLARAFGKDGFEVVEKGRGLSFAPENGDRKPVDTKLEYVIDGVSRPVGSCTHGWISDPNEPLPQTLTLNLPSSETVREVRLTFDTDLNPVRPVAHPPTLARDYRVEGLSESGSWTVLVECSDNMQRHRVHAVKPKVLKAVRISVLRTWGNPSARVFEVRIY